jgi:hypothetical protein
VQVRLGLLSKKANEKLAELVPLPVQVAAWVGAPQKKTNPAAKPAETYGYLILLRIIIVRITSF